MGVLERKGAKRHRKLEIWGDSAGCSKYPKN